MRVRKYSIYPSYIHVAVLYHSPNMPVKSSRVRVKSNLFHPHLRVPQPFSTATGKSDEQGFPFPETSYCVQKRDIYIHLPQTLDKFTISVQGLSLPTRVLSTSYWLYWLLGPPRAAS